MMRYESDYTIPFDGAIQYRSGNTWQTVHPDDLRDEVFEGLMDPDGLIIHGAECCVGGMKYRATQAAR